MRFLLGLSAVACTLISDAMCVGIFGIQTIQFYGRRLLNCLNMTANTILHICDLFVWNLSLFIKIRSKCYMLCWAHCVPLTNNISYLICLVLEETLKKELELQLLTYILGICWRPWRIYMTYDYTSLDSYAWENEGLIHKITLNLKAHFDVSCYAYTDVIGIK